MWHLLILCWLIPPQQPQAAVAFINLSEGQTLDHEAALYFGLAGMGIAPYGIQAKNTGHHHLLVNEDGQKLPRYRPVKTGPNHICYDGGQTQTTLAMVLDHQSPPLDLPTQITLQLVFVDYQEVQFDPVIQSSKVLVKIEK